MSDSRQEFFESWFAKEKARGDSALVQAISGLIAERDGLRLALSQSSAASNMDPVALVDRRNGGMKAHWTRPVPDLAHGTELFISKP